MSSLHSIPVRCFGALFQEMGCFSLFVIQATQHFLPGFASEADPIGVGDTLNCGIGVNMCHWLD